MLFTRLLAAKTIVHFVVSHNKKLIDLTIAIMSMNCGMVFPSKNNDVLD